MKFLIFGKTGQVARSLQALDFDAIFLGRDEANLENPEACAMAIETHKPDAVINAAAYTGVDQAESDEARATIVNAAAPSAMAQACAELGIPFVHISTDYVFDGTGETPWRPDDPVAPINAYGRSKLAGEIGVKNAGGRYGILRTSWVFSPFGTNFVKSMLRLSETRNQLSIVSDQIGGPTEASDIAMACVKLAQSLDKGGVSGIFHFCGAPAVSWADFARKIFEYAKRDVEVENIPTSQFPTPARRPANSRMDNSALLSAHAIEQPDWEKSLEKVMGILL